jgi:uncharacterized protein YqgV (UPF0045/DUF77 family)
MLESMLVRSLIEATPKLVGHIPAVGEASTLVSEIVKALIQKYNTAKTNYEKKPIDAKTTIEQRRISLLKRLTSCQNRILFEVSESELVSKLVPFVIEQGVCIFGAKTTAELTIVEMNIDQIQSVLNRNLELKRQRQHARMLVVAFNLIAISVLAALCYFHADKIVSGDERVPLLGIPWTIVLWSGIGSLGAMLYRFNKSADAELADPLRWCFTRPLTGVLMGIVAYLALKVGGLVLDPATKSAVNSPELLWVVAFLAGFSDKFSDAVLRTLSGRLGGEKHGDLVSLDAPKVSLQASMNIALDRLGWHRKPSAASLASPEKELPKVDSGGGAPTRRRRRMRRKRNTPGLNGKPTVHAPLANSQ